MFHCHVWLRQGRFDPRLGLKNILQNRLQQRLPKHQALDIPTKSYCCLVKFLILSQ